MRLELYPDEPSSVIKNEIDSYFIDGTIAERSHGAFIALMNEQTAGFVEVSDMGQKRCHLESWFVLPGMRHSGAGRALIKACESWARSRNAILLTSDTNEDYPDSPPAHKACGFHASENDTLFEKRLGDQS